jgi:hypothetical protein
MKALDDNENIEKEIDRMILELTSNLFCIYKFAKELSFKKKSWKDYVIKGEGGRHL